MRLITGILLLVLFCAAGYVGRGAWIWMVLARRGCSVGWTPEVQNYIQRKFRDRRQTDPSVQFEARIAEIERLANQAEPLANEAEELLKRVGPARLKAIQALNQDIEEAKRTASRTRPEWKSGFLKSFNVKVCEDIKL